MKDKDKYLVVSVDYRNGKVTVKKIITVDNEKMNCQFLDKTHYTLKGLFDIGSIKEIDMKLL